MRTILTILGFTLANFIAQTLVGERDFKSAFTYSIYQAVAIVYCWHIAISD